jgi:hypothetical protein
MRQVSAPAATGGVEDQAELKAPPFVAAPSPKGRGLRKTRNTKVG